MNAPKTIIWMSLLTLLSCQPSEDKKENPFEEDLHPVTFSIEVTEEVLPFPGTKSIPPLNIGEPTTAIRGENDKKTLKDHCCSIEYIVYKEGEEEPVRKKTFTKEDLDFGTISDKFPRGEYDFIIIAHSAEKAEVSDRQMSFDKLSDTFYNTFYMEIAPGQDNQEQVSLYRIVSRIEFISTDNVPDNAKEFTIAPNRYACLLNIENGKGIFSEETPPVFTYPLGEHTGKTGLTHAFYTFVPEENPSFSVDLQAIATDESILRERTVAGITPIANRIIRYSGRLYNPPHSDDQFEIIIDDNGKWEEPVENDLED